MVREGFPDKNKEPDVFEFDCPECGTHIVGTVPKCPSCGVEFIIEEVEELRCPECGEPLLAEATACSKCGAEFEIFIPEGSKAELGEETSEGEMQPIDGDDVEAIKEAEKFSEERSLKEEFPRLVAEVKPMLALAREFDVDTSQAKLLIDKAVSAGKQNDLEMANEYVRECKKSIESSIRAKAEEDIKDLDKLKEIALKMNEDPSPIEESKELARRELDSGDLKGALTHTKDGLRRAEVLTGKYVEAQNLVRELERLIDNSDRFYIDTSDVRKMLEEARAAEENGDYSMMGIMARKGREQMMALLPGEINEEMKRAKSALLDAKSEGKEVSTMVKLLKEAASALNREKYDEALEKLVEFRSELRHL
ncbi:MAG TPA: zinc-ribbon domain-containing protein [Methanomassiliicoccales archaeon]|nr:zinc-ribbon domain-containing protein [Methanomassiliicoccales archaeon]